jgi:threonine dehydratase
MMDFLDRGFQIDLQHVREARTRIADLCRPTPVLASKLDPEVYLKAENLQVTGSFKLRTAHHQMVRLTEAEKQRGVVTSSSGNFAQAVAYSAHRMGVSAKIVMMSSASPLKVSLTRRWGGEVVFCDDRFEARAEAVERIRQAEGRTVVFPYDHPDAIAGNGTIGLEILEQYPEVENVGVPASGGGMLAGIAFAVKTLKPSVKIWGVQPVGSNAAFLSFEKRDWVRIPRAVTIADGLIATCPGRLTLPLILEHVHQVVTVSEETILRAIRHLIETEKLVVEPAGAVPLAAVMEDRIPRDKTVLVLSGGNLTAETIHSALIYAGEGPRR